MDRNIEEGVEWKIYICTESIGRRLNFIKEESTSCMA
jgi:hypothetical protein